MENNLINITNQDGELLVSARELHKGLNVSERFSSWFNRMLQYGFDENVDYIGCKVFNTLANQELQDYALKLDMAKEICMVQRSEEGKQFRRYFIECEKQLIANALPVPQTTNLLNVNYNPYNNYNFKQYLNKIKAKDIPEELQKFIQAHESDKPEKRLAAYNVAKNALEELKYLVEKHWEKDMIQEELDALNKRIELQKTYINRSKLGQATKTINKLQGTIRQYELDTYDNYYLIPQSGFTTNCAYYAGKDQKIHTTAVYDKWREDIKPKLEQLPTLKEMNVNPRVPMKLDVFFYLKNKSLDVSNMGKSFFDALETHYKQEYSQFNDNMFADVRLRKYFSYSGSYEDSFITFGMKNMTPEEIADLTFDNDEE